MRVQAPDLGTGSTKGSQKVSQKTDVSSGLTADNFAVVIVDLAGNILETIPLNSSNATQNPDGSWSINVPGQPRLDCLIVSDFSGPIVLPSTGSIFDQDFLLAPTTDENLELDIASTAAYENFLDELGGAGTFASLNINTSDSNQLASLKGLIETVKQVVESEVFTGYTSVTDALAAIQTSVTEIVKVEADNIKNPAEGTMATMVANEGGIHWYEGLELSEIFYGVVTSNPEVEYEYVNGAFQEFVDPEPNRDLQLSNNGWVMASDNVIVTGSNPDGSITISDSVATSRTSNVKATQVFDLSGRNIHNYFKANSNTQALAAVLNQTATFGAGSKGYRVSITAENNYYSLWYTPGNETGVCPWDANKNANDFGGNCETIQGSVFNSQTGANDFTISFANFSDIYSSDVAPGNAGFKIIQISWFYESNISVQLINNANKTARYYAESWIGGNHEITLLSEGTWAQIDLPNLQTDNTGIVFSVPAAVVSQGDFDSQTPKVLIAKHNGFLRIGSMQAAGEREQNVEVLLNGPAASSIETAANYTSPYVGSWITEDSLAVFSIINNGDYALNIADDTCANGLERGLYGFIGVNFKYETQFAEAGDCGFDGSSGASTLSVDGDSLVVTTNGEPTSFTRVPNNGLLGTWIGGEEGEIMITFLAGNHFIFSQAGDTEGDGFAGVEYGTYTHDTSSGAFVPTVELNLNGDWGFSDPVGVATYSAVVNGDSMVFTFADELDQGSFTLTRVGPSSNL